MVKKIGSPKISTLLDSKKEKTWIARIEEKRGLINWFVVTLFVIGLVVVLFISLDPFFSVKHKLAASSFDKELEKKIIEDYYKLPNAGELPFADLDQERINENIREIVDRELTFLSGDYGVYVKNLNTGESFGTKENTIFTAASLIKLFVAGSYYKELDKNPNLFAEKLILREEDRVGGAGSLVNDPSGSSYELSFLVEKMLNQSDNTAFAMVTRFLGFSKVKKFIKSNGFSETNFEKNDTTPNDIGVFFEKLYKNELFDKNYTGEMIGSMTNTAFEDRLPFYLPTSTKISHKVGTWDGAYSDAGIIFAPKGDYIIVIMTDGADYNEAINTIRKLSEIIYNYFNK